MKLKLGERVALGDLLWVGMSVGLWVGLSDSLLDRLRSSLRRKL